MTPQRPAGRTAGAGGPVPAVERLVEALALLEPLVPPPRRAALREAVERAGRGLARVLVLGEAKRGKSSLVNALFDAPLLPTGVLPVTSVMTVVVAGDPQPAQVRFRSGRITHIPADAVGELVTEQGNPGNRRGVDRVLITAPLPHLPAGTEVVDTPGIGSVNPANTAEAQRSLLTLDIAVLVVAADPPISAADLGLLSQAMATAARTAVVVNKADRADPQELWEITRFTRHALADRFGQRVPVFALSALPGQGRAGLQEFVDWLVGEVGSAAASWGAEPTTRALRRELGVLEETARIEQELLRRSRTERAETLAALGRILARAADRADAAQDHLAGQARRLRTILDAAHGAAVQRVLQETAEILADGFPARTARRPEDAAERVRNAMAAHARRSAQRWYETTARELQADSERILRAELADLVDTAAEARRAAGGVLRLPLPPVEVELADTTRRPVSFEAAVQPGWEELVSTAVRRRLPAVLRRRRLARELAVWRRSAAPLPFGRARAALQQELRARTEQGTRLLRAAHQNHLAALADGHAAALARETGGAVEHDDADRLAVLRQARRLLS